MPEEAAPDASKTLNFRTDCEVAPDPVTKICDGAAETKLMALATGVLTVKLPVPMLLPGPVAVIVVAPLHELPSDLTAE